MTIKEIRERFPDINICGLTEEPLKNVIWTTIGVYGDQTIEDILKEKLSDINALNTAYNDGGYCLWALNKFKAEDVRKFCYTRQDKDTSIYVIMKITSSKNAKRKKGDMKSSERFEAKDIKNIGDTYSVDVKKQLHVEEGLEFPKELPHRETILKGNANFGKAFIVDGLGVLNSHLEAKKFLSKYKTFNGKNALDSIKGQNDSGLLSLAIHYNFSELSSKLDENE